MSTPDMDVIKEIPGYKVILKAVLKSQIQQLVETLANHTDEESVILTASVSDGTLSHLGSDSGKSFLEDHEDVKSQFLGFCLKRHHRQKQVEKEALRTPPTVPAHFGMGSAFQSKPNTNSPRAPRTNVQRQTTSYRPILPQGGFRPLLRHEPYPVSRPIKRNSFDLPDQGMVTGILPPSSTASSTIVKVEPVDNDSSEVNSSSVPSSSQTNNDNSDSNSGANKDDGSDPKPDNSVDECTQDSNLSDTTLPNTPNVQNTENSENDLDSNVSVKLESITENEMELEITGVEPGHHLNAPQENWVPDDSAGMGYDPSGATGNPSDMSPGSQDYNATPDTAQTATAEGDADKAEHPGKQVTNSESKELSNETSLSVDIQANNVASTDNIDSESGPGKSVETIPSNDSVKDEHDKAANNGHSESSVEETVGENNETVADDGKETIVDSLESYTSALLTLTRENDDTDDTDVDVCDLQTENTQEIVQNLLSTMVCNVDVEVKVSERVLTEQSMAPASSTRINTAESGDDKSGIVKQPMSDYENTEPSSDDFASDSDNTTASNDKAFKVLAIWNQVAQSNDTGSEVLYDLIRQKISEDKFKKTPVATEAIQTDDVVSENNQVPASQSVDSFKTSSEATEAIQTDDVVSENNQVPASRSVDSFKTSSESVQTESQIESKDSSQENDHAVSEERVQTYSALLETSVGNPPFGEKESSSIDAAGASHIATKVPKAVDECKTDPNKVDTTDTECMTDVVSELNSNAQSSYPDIVTKSEDKIVAEYPNDAKAEAAQSVVSNVTNRVPVISAENTKYLTDAIHKLKSAVESKRMTKELTGSNMSQQTKIDEDDIDKETTEIAKIATGTQSESKTFSRESTLSPDSARELEKADMDTTQFTSVQTELGALNKNTPDNKTLEPPVKTVSTQASQIVAPVTPQKQVENILEKVDTTQPNISKEQKQTNVKETVVTVTKSATGNASKPNVHLEKTPVKQSAPAKQRQKQSPQTDAKKTPSKPALKSPQTGGKQSFIDNLIATGVPIVIPDDDDDEEEECNMDNMPKARSNIFKMKSQQYRQQPSKTKSAAAAYKKSLAMPVAPPNYNPQPGTYQSNPVPQNRSAISPQRSSFQPDGYFQEGGMYSPTSDPYHTDEFALSPLASEHRTPQYEDMWSPPRGQLSSTDPYMTAPRPPGASPSRIAREQEAFSPTHQYASSRPYTPVKPKEPGRRVTFSPMANVTYQTPSTPPRHPSPQRQRTPTHTAVSPRMASPRSTQQISHVRRNIVSPQHKSDVRAATIGNKSAPTIVIDDDTPPVRASPKASQNTIARQKPMARIAQERKAVARIIQEQQQLSRGVQEQQQMAKNIQGQHPMTRNIQGQQPMARNIQEQSKARTIHEQQPMTRTIQEQQSFARTILEQQPMARAIQESSQPQSLPIIASVTSMATMNEPSFNPKGPAILTQGMTLPVAVSQPQYIPPASPRGDAIQRANEKTPVKRTRSDESMLTGESPREEPISKRRNTAGAISLSAASANIGTGEQLCPIVGTETIVKGQGEQSAETVSPSKVPPEVVIDIDIDDKTHFKRRLNIEQGQITETSPMASPESETIPMTSSRSEDVISPDSTLTTPSSSTKSKAKKPAGRRRNSAGGNFSCGECEKTFASKAGLKVHFKKHSEEKPFECDVCGKHFTQKSSLKKHIYTHFKDQDK